MITKTPDTEWCHGKGPLTFSCHHTFSFDKTRNSRLGTLTELKGWQVTSWSVRTKPTQEITSSVSPADALILSHGTSKIIDGNRERQGVLITKEGTSFTWLLGTFCTHIQPSVLCHSFPPWGLCGFSAQNLNGLMALASDQGQQSANMQTMFNNSPGCVWEPETPKLCEDSKQTLFIRPPGAVHLYS